MRGHLRSLVDAGIAERSRGDDSPAPAGYELTAAGIALLTVARALAAWLARSPQGSMQLGSAEAKNAIKALVDGWSANLARTLAARPLSLTGLNAAIVAVSYPSLERRLMAMRLRGLVQATQGESRSTPYVVTDWLREAVGPLAAAAGWEQRHQPGSAAPIGGRDAEAALLLTMPLLRLPEDVSGTCRLAVEVGDGQVDHGLGVIVEARNGAVVSRAADLEGSATAWARGSPRAWLAAMTASNAGSLELGGEPGLAAALVEAIHEVSSSP